MFIGVTTYVLADYQITEGTGKFVFAFTCFTTKICPAHVNVNSSGAEVGTAAAPLRIDPIGVGGSVMNVGQSGAWSVGITGTPAVSLPNTQQVTANAGTNLNTSLLVTDAHFQTFAGAASSAQGAAIAGKTGPMVQCSVTSSAPAYTTATVDPLNCDTTGNLRVNVVTATGVTQGATTAGATGSLVMGTTRTTALPTYGDSQSNILTTNTNGGLYVTPSSGTLGGAVPFHSYSAATTNATNVKGSAGTVYTLSLQNTNATVYYFKLYDKATAPTCGSDSVVWATAVSALATGYNTTIPFPTGLAFANGIGFCITAVQADADATVAATGITISIAYR